jgi:hypothetical protein
MPPITTGYFVNGYKSQSGFKTVVENSAKLFAASSLAGSVLVFMSSYLVDPAMVKTMSYLLIGVGCLIQTGFVFLQSRQWYFSIVKHWDRIQNADFKAPLKIKKRAQLFTTPAEVVPQALIEFPTEVSDPTLFDGVVPQLVANAYRSLYEVNPTEGFWQNRIVVASMVKKSADFSMTEAVLTSEELSAIRNLTSKEVNGEPKTSTNWKFTKFLWRNLVSKKQSIIPAAGLAQEASNVVWNCVLTKPATEKPKTTGQETWVRVLSVQSVRAEYQGSTYNTTNEIFLPYVFYVFYHA